MPVRYSQPRPTGGASVRIVAKPCSPTLTAVSWGWIRTRSWVVVVPARLAKNLFSWTQCSSAEVWLTPGAASSAADRSSIRPCRSASSTANGSTSYADTHVASRCTGSSASSTRCGVSGLETRAVATARSASGRRSSVVRPMPEAKPQTPSWTTRTASPTVVWSVLDSRLASRNVRTPSRIRSTRRSA